MEHVEEFVLEEGNDHANKGKGSPNDADEENLRGALKAGSSWLINDLSKNAPDEGAADIKQDSQNRPSASPALGSGLSPLMTWQITIVIQMHPLSFYKSQIKIPWLPFVIYWREKKSA